MSEGWQKFPWVFFCICNIYSIAGALLYNFYPVCFNEQNGNFTGLLTISELYHRPNVRSLTEVSDTFFLHSHLWSLTGALYLPIFTSCVLTEKNRKRKSRLTFVVGTVVLCLVWGPVFTVLFNSWLGRVSQGNASTTTNWCMPISLLSLLTASMHSVLMWASAWIA